MTGIIQYASIEKEDSLVNRARELHQNYSILTKKIVLVKINGEVLRYQNVFGETSPQKLGNISSEGKIDRAIINAMFGANCVLYEIGGEKYMEKVLEFLKSLTTERAEELE